MKKLLIYVVPFALVAAHASGAPSSGWGGMGAFVLLLGSVPERARLWCWCSVVAVAAVAALTGATSTGQRQPGQFQQHQLSTRRIGQP